MAAACPAAISVTGMPRCTPRSKTARDSSAKRNGNATWQHSTARRTADAVSADKRDGMANPSYSIPTGGFSITLPVSYSIYSDKVLVSIPRGYRERFIM